jgi:tetratricopeptide (TPR) repeat protein
MREDDTREEVMGRRPLDIDNIAMDLILSDDIERKRVLAKRIFDIAYKKGIYPSSIHQFYMARGRGEFGGFTPTPESPVLQSGDEWLPGSEFRPSKASAGTHTEKKPRDLSRGVFTVIFSALSLCFSIIARAQDDPVKKWMGMVEEAARFYDEGKYEQGIKTAKESIAFAEGVFGADNPNLGSSLNVLGQLYAAAKDYGQAESAFRRALGLYQNSDSPDLGLALTLGNLAKMYEAQNKNEEAKRSYEEASGHWQKAISDIEDTLGTNHLSVANNLEEYALVLRKIGKEQEAAQLEGRAREIRSAADAAAPAP